MIKKKNYFIKFTILLIFLIFIFLNSKLIAFSVIDTSTLFFKNVFPFMFLMMTINKYLLETNFINYFKNPYDYIFIMSILGGSPFNSIIINDLLNKNIINLNGASKALGFTSFYNPLFIYNILSKIIINKYSFFIIILSFYMINIIIYLINRNKLHYTNLVISNKKLNINNIFSSTMNEILSIYSIIVFIKLLSDIFFKNNNKYFIIIKGMLEITQGLNLLLTSNLSNIIKELETILILSFGGFSILLQSFNILSKHIINYKYMYITKIIILIITSIILYSYYLLL